VRLAGARGLLSGGKAKGGHQLLLAGVQGVPGGELAVQPGADLHPGQASVAGECGRVGAVGEVGARQVVFAVPVRAVGQAPVGRQRSQGISAGLIELFWSNVNPYGAFRLDMDQRLDLAPAPAVPRPGTPADVADRSATQTR